MAAPMEVSLPQTLLQKLLDLLKLESFRPHQEIAIQSIIQDQKDAVICVPTGAGKSLCYEVLTRAAAVFAQSQDGQSDKDLEGEKIVLVVSPLLSLMSRQAEKTRE